MDDMTPTPEKGRKQALKRKKPEHQLWLDSCAAAQAALEELVALQADYQNDYDNLSEAQQESRKGELLSAICDLNLEGALDAIQEAAEIELP
jgi:hypothetical protein